MEKMRQKKKTNLRKELPFHLMLLPGVIFTIIFCYVPNGWNEDCISEVYSGKRIFW